MFYGACVGMEDGSDSLVYAEVVEYSVVLFFIVKFKYAGFSLSIETVASVCCYY